MRRCSGWHIVALAALSVATMAARSADAGVQEPAASDVDAPMTGTVVIGSKNFTENRLLAEIMAALIEAETDITVERRINLGGTTVVFSALRTGQIDLYPEYTGTGWTIHLGRTDRVNDPLRAYVTVDREFEDRWNIQWLEPFGFANSYALAMDTEVADELGIDAISELVAIEDELSAGVSHEFLNREDGYPGLAVAYGLDIDDLRGMEHGLAYEAIRTGRINIVDTWTTDGKLLRYDIRILDDDSAFFPPYDAAPIVRGETLDALPGLGPLLNRLAFRIDNERMRQLNYRVEEEGGTFEQVARDFLREEGLLDPDRTAGAAATRDNGFLRFLWSRRGETAQLVLEHLWLTGTAVLLAILTAVPLGIWLSRRIALAAPVVGAAGVIQTVPSLALLAFMIPLPGLGLGARSAIAALFLYALLPILRNTYTGIREVDSDLIEAARGMGLNGGQILWRVELPLATRTIMAGIRTSTVISIGVATLAAFIGAGGLGDPIVTGLQLNDIQLIMAGAIPAALLAILVDWLLGSLESALVPRGLD
jgi:osmoprotectant transport system permease protein